MSLSLPPFLTSSLLPSLLLLSYPSLSSFLKKYFEIGSHNVAWVAGTFYIDQAGVKLIKIPLPLSPKCWGPGHAPSCPWVVSLDAPTLRLTRQLLYQKLSGPLPSFALASEREFKYKIQVLATVAVPLPVCTQTHLTLLIMSCLMGMFLFLPPQLA